MSVTCRLDVQGEGDDVRAQIGLARHGVKGLTLAVYTG